jgi:hypothetical protein
MDSIKELDMSKTLQTGDEDSERMRPHAIRVAMEERERLMRNRVADAIREGHFWAIVRAELARDYSSLFDNIWRLERQIDRSYAANCREPPVRSGNRH